MAGIRVPPLDRRQSVSLGDGAGLPGTLRDRLQPQRRGRPRRHQLGRAVPRRLCAREQNFAFAGRARYRQERRDRSAAARRASRRPINFAARGMLSRCSTITPSLGGMVSYGMPGFRHAAQACWMRRSSASSTMGVEVRLNTRIGVDVHAERPRSRLRRGAARHGLQSRPEPARVRGRTRRTASAPPRFSRPSTRAGCNRWPAGGGGWRRRHLDRRRHGGAPAGPRRGHEGDGAPGVRGAGLHRARCFASWRREHGRRRHADLGATHRGDARGQARDRATPSARA